MIASARPRLQVILYEGPQSTALNAEQRFKTLESLLDRGFSVLSSTSAEIDSHDVDALLILGQFAADHPKESNTGGDQVTIQFLDITNLSGEDLVGQVEQTLETLQLEVNQPGKWKPWFPVIDYDRCTNCMQCLSFCLFDVYGVDDENMIQVQNNDNCKTDCPACSRVCPEVAIMFPKYGAGPIHGGEVSEDDVKRESMKVDISALLGGDIYNTLRDRSESAKQRFARERDDSRALNERKRCLKKLAGLDIPKSALKDLPTPDEIRTKAAEAKRKAEVAMAAIQSKKDEQDKA